MPGKLLLAAAMSAVAASGFAGNQGRLRKQIELKAALERAASFCTPR